MVDTRKANKHAHPGLVDRPPPRRSRDEILREKRKAADLKKSKGKTSNNVVEMEEAIHAKETQDRAEARQPRGPSVLKTTRPLKTTKPMTQNHTRDTAAMNEDDDASLKDTANGNCATKSQKDSREENVRLTKRTFNDLEKGNDSEFDDVECRPSKKTKASAVSTFRSTSQPATSGVIPGWSSIVEASVPNHNKKPAFPYGKIAQHSQPAPNSRSADSCTSGRNTSVNPFSGLDDHPDLPDVPPDVEITKAQKPIISMEQKSLSQRAPTCGVSPQGSVGEAQRQTSTDYIPEWPATSSSVSKEQEDQVWPDPSPSGADRTSSQSLSQSKTQGTTRRTVPLSLFRFAVPLDSSDDDAPLSTQFKNRVNSDSKFRSDVDMDAPTSAQPSKRSHIIQYFISDLVGQPKVGPYADRAGGPAMKAILGSDGWANIMQYHFHGRTGDRAGGPAMKAILGSDGWANIMQYHLMCAAGVPAGPKSGWAQIWTQPFQVLINDGWADDPRPADGAANDGQAVVPGIGGWAQM
ncbi:hypothetical protein C8R48DRAFT_680191 [Suillus tomentosus]|nr:hypothetical protein C8R48DRAFT_680191 [Suillus tomentosus]